MVDELGNQGWSKDGVRIVALGERGGGGGCLGVGGFLWGLGEVMEGTCHHPN